MAASAHGSLIQGPSQVARGVDVKLNFVLRATWNCWKRVKGIEKNFPVDMQVLQCLDHLKSQHGRSTSNSTNMRVRMGMGQFPFSSCL